MDTAMEPTDETVEVQLGHPTEPYRFKMQSLVLTRPESGYAKMPVTCNVCGKEITIFVGSRRRALRAVRGVQIATLIIIALFIIFMYFFVSTNPILAPQSLGLIIFTVVFSLIMVALPFILRRWMLKNNLRPVIRMTGAQVAATLAVGSLANVGRHRLLNPNGIGLVFTERQNGASPLAIRISRGEP